jgi:predicted amidophosphoribosyltransferase
MAFEQWLEANKKVNAQVPLLKRRFASGGGTIDDCYLHDYFPSRMAKYHHSHRGTQAILALKRDEAKDDIIEGYANIIASLVPRGATICRVPCHTIQNKTTGIDRILEALEAQGFTTRPDLITRTKELVSATKGGVRSLDLQLESMQASRIRDSEAAFVVILDDVMTSGSSMGAAYDHAVTAGAKQVEGIALAKTAPTF